MGKTSLVQTFVNGSFKKGLFSSISHEYQRKVSSVGCQVMMIVMMIMMMMMMLGHRVPSV